MRTADGYHRHHDLQFMYLSWHGRRIISIISEIGGWGGGAGGGRAALGGGGVQGGWGGSRGGGGGGVRGMFCVPCLACLCKGDVLSTLLSMPMSSTLDRWSRSSIYVLLMTERCVLMTRPQAFSTPVCASHLLMTDTRARARTRAAWLFFL